MTTPADAKTRATEAARVERARAVCLSALLAGYGDEVTVDNSVPGADRLGRYVVELENERRSRAPAFARCASREMAATVATADLADGWEPVALYDLDEPAGDWPATIGDRVEWEDRQWMVEESEPTYGAGSGSVCHLLMLALVGDDGEVHREVDAEEVEVVERSGPDERRPAHFALADMRTIVVFDTQPSA